MRDFLDLACLTHYSLCKFSHWFNKRSKARLSMDVPLGNFASYMEWVLVNSPFTICLKNEANASPTLDPESSQPSTTHFTDLLPECTANPKVLWWFCSAAQTRLKPSGLQLNLGTWTPWTSGPLAVPNPYTLSAQSGSSFPPAPPQSSGTLAPPRPFITASLPWPSGPLVPSSPRLRLGLQLYKFS
ncbi:hypothetical protein PO909_013767 [Leuciscus waleckii]